jgi:hypothetical protein
MYLAPKKTFLPFWSSVADMDTKRFVSVQAHQRPRSMHRRPWKASLPMSSRLTLTCPWLLRTPGRPRPRKSGLSRSSSPKSRRRRPACLLLQAAAKVPVVCLRTAREKATVVPAQQTRRPRCLAVCMYVTCKDQRITACAILLH